jgi:DUF1680 family protein
MLIDGTPLTIATIMNALKVSSTHYFAAAFLSVASTIACTPSDMPESGTIPPLPGAVVTSAVAVKAHPFDLADVRLLESPFKSAMETDKEYLLRLEPDRFLAWFRKEAGLQPKGKVYGGWESRGVAGFTLGHYLSACSEMYRATGDERLRDRVAYIVKELAECQKANGDGYVGAIPGGKKAFAEMKFGQIRPKGGFMLNDIWVPWYTIHKDMAGLLDAWVLCGNTEAREVLVRLTDWVNGVVGKLDEAKMQVLLSVEQGGMAESIANFYALTGEPRYLALARKFRDKTIFAPMAEGRDILNGWHGNCQIPKMIGYQRVYELTGESEWGASARNFWNFVTRDRSFNIGGHGLGEHFFPADQFEKAMTNPVGPETCNTYNMLKLTRHLFATDAEASEMDFYELALYNHILPSQHPKTGGLVYYTALVPSGAYRTYSTDTGEFWCCVGTGIENHALYGEGIYAYKKNRLYVNLFIPSVLTWRDKGVTITQSTKFPAEPHTELSFKTSSPRELTMAVRYPAWVAPGALKLTVNGKTVPCEIKPGGYAEVTCAWKDGDVLGVDLPMRITTGFLPGSTNYVSIFYGPLVLGGKLGREGLTDRDFITQTMTKMLPLAKTPVIVVPPDQIAAHLEPVESQTLTFRSKGLFKPEDLTLVPLYRIHDERYAPYWRLTNAEAWQAEVGRISAEEERVRHDLEERTVDSLNAGEQQPEVDHAFKGEKTNSGYNQALNRNWRDARDGGWFSYILGVDKAGPLELVCTYWGGDADNREFDIQVDGVVVATEKLTGKKPGQLLEIVYQLPESALAGKKSVTVKFQAKPGQRAGGLFGCRVMKSRQP